MEEANDAIRISPHELAVFDVVAVAYMAQNRPDEARAILNTGLSNNPENRASTSTCLGSLRLWEMRPACSVNCSGPLANWRELISWALLLLRGLPIWVN